MTIDECKNKIKSYTENAKDTLEVAMNIIECDDELNNVENKEIDTIYKKLSDAIEILESI